MSSLRDKADTRSLVGTVIGVGGAAILITGVIKLGISPSAPSSVTAWNFGVSGSGLVVSGRF